MEDTAFCPGGLIDSLEGVLGRFRGEFHLFSKENIARGGELEKMNSIPVGYLCHVSSERRHKL